MLNKRRKNMDPKRISNYNKFLTTLDQQFEPKTNPNLIQNLNTKLI